MLWGIGARSYWDDEADTVSAVSRSLPQLARLLGHIDAVHGLYYLMLWPVARVGGTSELVTRLPSAVAMAAAAAGVTLIGRRLVSPRAGLYAGLVFAVLPTVSDQGHNARPYALTTAAAVLASYLLVRVAAEPQPRWLAVYGLSLTLLGYLQLFGLLVVPAHAVALLGLRTAAGKGQAGSAPSSVLARRWLAVVAAVGVAVSPVAIAGWAQRAQISWIPRLGWQHDASNLVVTLAAGAVAGCVLAWLVGVVFGALPVHRGLAWLAVPWLMLPPTLLVAASEIRPVYNHQYVTFCLPAVALLAGSGLAALRWPLRATALALALMLVAPQELGLRAPGGGMRAVARFLSVHERPGDAIVYPGPDIPPWYLAYPDGFARLHDLSLRQTPAAAGHLYASAVPLLVLERRERGVHRIWAVQVGKTGQGPAARQLPGFRLAHEWRPGGHLRVWLYLAATDHGTTTREAVARRGGSRPAVPGPQVQRPERTAPVRARPPGRQP